MKHNKQTYLILGLSVIIIGLLSYIGHSQKEQPQEKKAITTKLIEINGAASGGISQDEWSSETRKLSILIDTYILHRKVNSEEERILRLILSTMNNALTLWRFDSRNCYIDTKKKSCLSELAEKMYYADFLIVNPNYTPNYTDDSSTRIFLTSDNSTLSEYTDIVKSQNSGKEETLIESLVPAMLSLTSRRINQYLKDWGKK